MADRRYNVVLGKRTSRRTVVRGALSGLAGLGALGVVGCGSNKNNNNAANSAAATATKASAAPSASAAASASAVATRAGSPAAGTAAGGTPSSNAVGAAGTATATKLQLSPGTPGGNYRAGFIGPFAGVDPHNSVYGGSGIVPEVYSYLLRTSVIAPQEGIIPELALSQETSPDNTSVTFKLRPDAMIQQNSLGVPVRPIDSGDAKASFERVGDPKAASNGYAWIHEWVDKFEAIDPTTFKITTKAPYAWVLNNVGNNLYSAIVPKEWLASPNLKANAVGSGPFMLQSLQEGAQAVMVKNPTYFEKGLPYVDQVTINAYGDQATYRTAFSSGQLDTYTAINIDDSKAVAQALKNSQRYEDPSFGFNSFWMNTKMKPWDDPRIRQAVRLAVNPDEYIQLVAHGQGKQIGPVTYAMQGYALPDDELKKLMPFDVKQAKQVLAAAGQPNLTFKFQYPTGSNTADYANVFVRQMQQAGMTAQAEPQDPGTWVAGYFTSKLSASLSLNQEYANPDFALHWYTTGSITGGGQYDTGFSDPEVDAAVKKAAGTIDVAARTAAYQDAQRLIISKSPAFWNFYGAYTNIVADPAVQNYPKGLGSLGYDFTKTIWLKK